MIYEYIRTSLQEVKNYCEEMEMTIKKVEEMNLFIVRGAFPFIAQLSSWTSYWLNTPIISAPP